MNSSAQNSARRKNPGSAPGDRPDSRNRVRHTVSGVLKFIVPVAVTVGLVVWLFHKVDFRQVEEIMSHGVDYRFMVLMMGLVVLSHIIRGIRWGIQLRAAGIPPVSPVAESVSIFGAYALNLVFPFMGEAWRCVYMARREKVKLATVVGTDIGDRASDGIMILLLVFVALFVARPEMYRFLDRYPLGESIHHILTDNAMWVWAVVAVGLLVVADRVFRTTPFVEGINMSVKRMWDGFRVLFHMKGTGLYILLTFGIWICYFLETYVCFFAFPFTRRLITDGAWLGLVPGLVVFVFGSCSMGIPSNGGLGPWNIAVMFALSLFGISDTDGAAFAMLTWSFQTAINIASGIFAAGYIMLSKPRAGHGNNQPTENVISK